MTKKTAKIYLRPFKDQMLDKYPNMFTVAACSVCKSDLRYSNKIHRIDMEWYCHTCYKKYKIPLIKGSTKLKLIEEIQSYRYNKDEQNTENNIK